MPKIIALSVRAKVIELFILKNAVPAIAEALKISESAVRNIIQEFNRGEVPGFEQFADSLPDLQWAATKFKESGVTLEKAVVGYAMYESVAKLGLPNLEPEKFNAALKRLLKLIPTDHQTEKLVNAAILLLTIEEDTGLSYDGLVKTAYELASRVKSLQATISSLTQQRQTYEKTLANLKREVEEAYAKKELTEKQANEISAIIKRMQSAGISFEDLEKLRQILMVARSEGWSPKSILTNLATIGNLQSRISELITHLNNLEKTVRLENTKLQGLHSQEEMIQSQVNSLWGSLQNARSLLTQIQTLTAQQQLRLELSETFFKLLTNPSDVTTDQLIRFIEAGAKVHWAHKLSTGLPVDYSELRKEMQLLVELVLGDQLVSRNVIENELKNLHAMNQDLLLGGLNTFEKEHAKLNQKKREIVEASVEKFLASLANEDTSFEIVLFKCLHCYSITSYYKAPQTKPAPIRCPNPDCNNHGTVRLLRKFNIKSHAKTDQAPMNQPQMGRPNPQINPQIEHK